MCKEAVLRFGMGIREIFWNTISLPVTNEYEKGAVMQISTELGHVYHVAFRGPLKQDFLDIYLATFSESVISEIQKL